MAVNTSSRNRIKAIIQRFLRFLRLCLAGGRCKGV